MRILELLINLEQVNMAYDELNKRSMSLNK